MNNNYTYLTESYNMRDKITSGTQTVTQHKQTHSRKLVSNKNSQKFDSKENEQTSWHSDNKQITVI